jgi:hypothetical protein
MQDVWCVLTVEHNYISSGSTLGLQLRVSALYVGHLQVVTSLSEQLYKMCGVSDCLCNTQRFFVIEPTQRG